MGFLFQFILFSVQYAEGDSLPVHAATLSPKQKIYCERAFSDIFHQLTELCLLRNACERPTASQLLTHSFFKHCRRNCNIIELLHPVIPMSDKIANNPG